MNFDVLRQKILEKAIRGELVPQLENEPEAAQIGDSPKEVPFTIPEKWKWLKLGSVFRLKAGKFISSSEIKETGKYPCFGGNGIRGYVDHYNKEGKFPLIGRQGALCGNINIADGRFYATEHAVVADGGELIDSDCAAYFLKQLNLNQYATKTAQPGISVKRISETPFPLPSLEEQRRIVTKINQFFEQIDCAEKAYNELSGPLSERFRQLCLEKAIQGKLVPQLESEPEVTQIGEAPEDVPFAIPEKWRWVRVSDVAHINPKVTAQTSSTEVSFIPMAALSAGYISQIALDAKSSWGTVKNGYTKFIEGDVLLAKITPCFQNRKSAIAKKLSNGIGCGSSEFHVLRVNENIVTQEYLLMFLKSQWFITYGVENFKGTAGQQRLGTSDLKNCLFPLPPMSEQHRIVAKLNELLDSVKHLEYNVSKT